MELIELKILSQNKSNYDHILLNNSTFTKKNTEDKLVGDLASGDGAKNYHKTISLHLDAILTHYIVRELEISQIYRGILVNILRNKSRDMVIIKLLSPQKEIIDYSWNERTTHMAWERLELDHALSWLSTLGGAFSALGDYFSNAAQMAGKISLHQFKLALRLDDPNIQARCRLFMSLSCIQQGRLTIARRIVSNEYRIAKNAIVVDQRLVKMCLGIWAKLKYEWKRNRSLCRELGLLRF